MNFNCVHSTRFYKMTWVFTVYIPESWKQDEKHNKFCNILYEMKTHFRFFLSHDNYNNRFRSCWLFWLPKFRVAHTKHDVISILMNKYIYINMYIIKKILISYIFILCRDITALINMLPKTTNFLKSWGWKKCLYLKIISYSA